MRQRLVTTLCVCCLFCVVPAGAQSADPATTPAENEAPATTHVESFWAPFIAVPKDVKQFVSGHDTFRVLAPAAVGSLFASQFDHEGIDMALTRFQPPGAFTAGNIGGGFVVQTGGAFALYTIGHLSRSPRVRGIGADLVRSQILTQLTVQTVKGIIRRQRPDDSDRMSLPSGHAAGTFATATVLQKHFGWKVGMPVYAAGAYVATARMSANKHHLSDVIMGAAVGVAAAHTVTIGSGNRQFSVGVSPTDGGAALTFTRLR